MPMRLVSEVNGKTCMMVYECVTPAGVLSCILVRSRLTRAKPTSSVHFTKATCYKRDNPHTQNKNELHSHVVSWNFKHLHPMCHTVHATTPWSSYNGETYCSLGCHIQEDYNFQLTLILVENVTQVQTMIQTSRPPFIIIIIIFWI